MREQQYRRAAGRFVPRDDRASRERGCFENRQKARRDLCDPDPLGGAAARHGHPARRPCTKRVERLWRVPPFAQITPSLLTILEAAPLAGRPIVAGDETPGRTPVLLL